MYNLFRLLCLAFLAINVQMVAAQKNVLISDDPAAIPNSSAVLDVQSTDKGALFPRMNSAMRMGINNPAVGLLVFDTDTESFWYNTSSGWVNLGKSAWINSGDTVVYTPDRKVGIGLDNPRHALHAKGSLVLQESGASGVADGEIWMTDAAGFDRVHFNKQYFPSETRFRIEVNSPDPAGVARIQFFRSTAATTKLVEFFRGDASMFGTERSAVIGVDGANSFFQFSGGNMGIGTDQPTEKLHVVGNLLVDGNIKATGTVSPSNEIVIIEERTSASGSDGGPAPNNLNRRNISFISANSPNVSMDFLNFTFTLQPGTYLIQASAPAYRVDRHQLLLRNVVTGNADLVGTNEFSNQPATGGEFGEQTSSSIFGFVTVPQNSTATYQLMTWVQTTSFNNAALGWAHSNLGVGTGNVYARIVIEKTQ